MSKDKLALINSIHQFQIQSIHQFQIQSIHQFQIQLQDDAAFTTMTTNYEDDIPDSHKVYIVGSQKVKSIIASQVAAQNIIKNQHDAIDTSNILETMVDHFLDSNLCLNLFIGKEIKIKTVELVEQLILAGANVDFNPHLSSYLSSSIIKKLYNDYEHPSVQQKITEIFACIIARDLFSCSQNIIEHLLEIKKTIGQNEQGFEFLKKHIVERFVKLYLEEHSTITSIEKYSSFIETITEVNPALGSILDPLTKRCTEAEIAIGDMSNLLLETLG